MLAADVTEAAAAEPTGAVRLLPAFDPYVVAAPRGSDAVLHPDHRARLPRAGPAHARAARRRQDRRVWSHETARDGTVHVALEPFARVARAVRGAVEEEADRLGASSAGRRPCTGLHLRPQSADDRERPMADSVSSVPPPSSPPPAPGSEPPAARAELTLALEASRGRRKPRASEDDRLHLSVSGVSIEHGRVLQAPLEFPLGLVKVATVDPGPARASGQFGRFPILRRVSRTAVIPRSEGIEGWLWTSTGGTALTNLGEDDEAPNVALVFTKPLDEDTLRAAFDPEFVTGLAARSPLGSPVVLGVLFRVADTLPATNGFRRWGFQDILTDREIAPVQRRHLPFDVPADPTVGRGGSDQARAATSVAPPGFS